MPSFIYLHFPSRDLDLVEKFREGELQYSKAMEDIPPGAVEGMLYLRAMIWPMGFMNP